METQFKKETLQDFNDIMDSIIAIKDPDVLLTDAVLAKAYEATIDPGSPNAPEDDPGKAKESLSFQEWLDFFKYYDKQHTNIPGDYYTLNSVKICNDLIAQKKEAAKPKEEKKEELKKEELKKKSLRKKSLRKKPKKRLRKPKKRLRKPKKSLRRKNRRRV